MKFLSIHKCILFTMSILCFICNSCKKISFSKDNITWHQITNGDLYDIVFLDSLRGYAVGGIVYTQSEILATNDGGNTWHNITIDLNYNKTIFGVTALNDALMAVGIDGKTYLNEGAPLSNWQAIQTYRWHAYKAIAFSSNDKGVIVGGRAHDYGEINNVDIWGNASNEMYFDFELTDILFTKNNIGFISGYGTMLKSTDEGAHWDTLSLKGDFFKAVHFQEVNQTLWTVGYNGSIFRSKDLGLSWEKIRNGNNPFLKKMALNNIFFIDDKIGFIVGDDGLILKTNDGGNNWNAIKPFTKNDLHGIYGWGNQVFISGKNGTLFKLSI